MRLQGAIEMRQRFHVVAVIALGFATLAAATQNPPTQNPPVQNPPAQNPPAGQRGGGASPAGARGGGGGRRNVSILTLSTTAWPDGGTIPAKYSQAGAEVSPPLMWTGMPEGMMSLVLVVHDIDAASGNGTDDLLQWLVWNIPPATTSLPEGVPQGPELPDGTRQISVTGPYYRGPAAPASGPVHHYLFELYALDTTLEVMPVGAAPAATRAAVLAAMAGHIRAKGTMVGLYRR
jgi:Raf kinase inhibitor-like YbhB/YbcL family protein